MLVLSRKLGEKVTMELSEQGVLEALRSSKNGTITIEATVVDIDRGKIRLGIEAPEPVKIWRNELLADRKTAVTTPAAVLAGAG